MNISKTMRYITVLGAVFFLAGCGEVKNMEPADVTVTEEQLKTDSTKEQYGSSEEDAPAGEMGKKSLYAEDKKGCVIQEDENFIYLCSSYEIRKIDKNTKKSEILWSNEDGQKKYISYRFSEGSGLLLGNKLYFIEAWMTESLESKALSVIHTDGTGYRRIENLTDAPEGKQTGKNLIWSMDTMLLQNGLLFIDTYVNEMDENRNFIYQVYGDGTLSERISPEDMETNVMTPRDYEETAYKQNGVRRLFAQESMEAFGYLISSQSDGSYSRPVRIDSDTGKMEEFPVDLMINKLTGHYVYYSLENYNESGLLFGFSDQENGDWKYFLTDQKTMETNLLFCTQVPSNVIAMDDSYVYIFCKDQAQNHQNVFQKVSLETGEETELFRRNESQIMGFSPEYVMDMVVQNGYIYYADEKDFSLYLMRRSLAEPEKEEVLGEPLYDPGFAEVGELVMYQRDIYSDKNPEKLLASFDFLWLQVDGRFPGADTINSCIRENEAEQVKAAEDFLRNLSEEEEVDYVNVSLSSDIQNIPYFDGHYLSFCQYGYEYYSGAHVMPFWTGYTFDLQTGERLELKDIVADSEEQVKDLESRYYEALITESPESFWDDALSTVRESAGLKRPFYLGKDGIHFYYEPYSLACYAAGFQEVVIPYEEFDMKIRIEEAE